MVGDRKDSALYVKNKHTACRKAGIRSVNYLFQDDVSQVRALRSIVLQQRCCSSIRA